MITFEEALEIAKKENGRIGIGLIWEAKDFWIFCPKIEDLDIGSTTAVRKDTGEVFQFFPPDYPVDFKKSCKKITL